MADFVDGHITAFVRHLGRHDNDLPGCDPLVDGGLEASRSVIRDSAYPEGFNDQGVVPAHQYFRNGSVTSGDQTVQEHRLP